MAERVKTHAPYNFVPFSNKVLLRYDSPDQLPPHNVWNSELKSGEIHVTLRAETPVLVSDGQEKYHARFVKGADGTYQIPGSTVRGLLRQTMQILGFGLIRACEDLEDYQIYFRDMASAKESSGAALKEYYQAVMKMKTEKVNGKSRMVPEAVQSGYLHRENGQYYILPTVAPVLRISRKHADAEQFGDTPARTVPVFYRDNGQTATALSRKEQAGWKRGVLLFTGKPVGMVSNCPPVCPGEGTPATALDIFEEDILSYTVDWEERRNSLGAYYDPAFWSLPDEGQSKPVFFVQHDSHIYFGMSRMLRIGYRFPLSHGLPQRQRELAAEQSLVLDYPHAVLGYADPDSAYRSRVSVGDFRLTAGGTELPGVRTVLGGPKASFYSGYAADGKHYNEEDFQLRGHKFYWLKETAKAAAPATDNEKVGITLHPLDKGSTFQGIIRYRNLHPDELGLLLWCIRLDPGCFHSLGMGKPYGYGRIAVTIDRLVEWDPSTLYTAAGLTGGGVEPKNLEQAVETYIRTYDNYAAAALHIKKPKKNPSVRSRDEIQDLLYLRSTLRSGSEVEYMALTDFKNCIGALPSVQELRPKAEEPPAPTAKPPMPPKKKRLW